METVIARVCPEADMHLAWLLANPTDQALTDVGALMDAEIAVHVADAHPEE